MIKSFYKYKKKVTVSVLIICFMFLYPLFIMTRFKQLASPVVSDIATTNEVWIIPILIVFKKFFCDIGSTRRFKAITIMLFAFLFTIILSGGLRVDSIEQYLYAIAVFIIPIPLLYVCTNKDIRYLNLFLKVFTLICLIYSVIYIFATFNYKDLSMILGNIIQSHTFISSGQYRAKMMIGSPVTVANYFTMTLPILFYMYFKNSRNMWSMISLVTILLNFTATVLTLSRLGFLISILISLFCVMFQKENKIRFWKRCIIVIFILGGFLFIVGKYDIGRLFMGFSDSSSEQRLQSFNLAVYIFKLYPMFGSGMGNYFIRVYIDNSLSVGQVYGLVDPHNIYVLILSEMGVVGFLVLGLLICRLIHRISKIQDRMFRTTGYLILLATGLSGVGGSHLVNEISYSIVFWIYMSLFYTVSFFTIEDFQEITGNK